MREIRRKQTDPEEIREEEEEGSGKQVCFGTTHSYPHAFRMWDSEQGLASVTADTSLWSEVSQAGVLHQCVLSHSR